MECFGLDQYARKGGSLYRPVMEAESQGSFPPPPRTLWFGEKGLLHPPMASLPFLCFWFALFFSLKAFFALSGNSSWGLLICY